MTTTSIPDFHAYFNLADELWEGRLPSSFAATVRLTIDDFDKRMVKAARRSADQLGLSWPPSLPEAEEWALDHRAELAG